MDKLRTALDPIFQEKPINNFPPIKQAEERWAEES